MREQVPAGMVDLGDIGPNFLDTYKYNNLKWPTVLSELCDNSLDAGANRIEIDFGPGRTLSINDNGSGCDDLVKMLTVASHYRKKTTALGRFGVGLKEAVGWMWGKTAISTTANGTNLFMLVDWEKLSKAQNWFMRKPITTNASDLKNGTTIHCSNIQKNLPSKERTIVDLSYIFYPALIKGKEIILNFPRKKGIRLKPWKVPNLEHVVSDTFLVKNKVVVLKAGIVPESQPNFHYGFNFAYKHRIISNESIGGGKHSLDRICALVELKENWKLSKNKNSVVDQDLNLLEEEIYKRCKSIIQKSEKQCTFMYNNAFLSDVTTEFNDILTNNGRAKGKRGPKTGIKRPAAIPTGEGSPHKNAKEIQDGDTFFDKSKIKRINGYKLQWHELPKEEIGRVDSRSEIIYLNPKHPRIKSHSEKNNKHALVDNCLLLASNDSSQGGNFRCLPAPWAKGSNDFLTIYSHLAANHCE